MGYRKHEVFQVSDWDQAIWRYITIPQLLSILKEESLRFTRSDNFDDPFEGELPRKNKAELPTDQEIDRPDYFIYNGRSKRGSSHWEPSNQMSTIQTYREITFINCWHQEMKEQSTLWRANVAPKEGVVIKSDVQSLKTALSAHKYEVYIGEMKYIDFEQDKIPYRDNQVSTQNRLYPFMYKRDGFQQENELRAVVTEMPSDYHPGYEGLIDGEQVPLDWDIQPPGKYINVHIEDLVDEVRVSPYSGSWVVKTLRDVVSEYGYDFAVNESELSTEP